MVDAARRESGLQRPERATTLILVPVMMLVVITLAGIAVDMSALHQSKRRAHTVVAIAAADAAGLIDEQDLQSEGTIAIDAAAARRVTIAHIAASDIRDDVVGDPVVTLSADRRRLTVTITLRVRHIFVGSIGRSPEAHLTVAASARLTIA